METISRNLFFGMLTIVLFPQLLFGGNFSVNFGPEYVYVDFHVKRTPTTSPANFRGGLWGVTGAVEYRESNGVYLNLNSYWVKGSIENHRLDERNHFTDERIEGRVGYNLVFGCDKQWRFTPYTGLKWARVIRTNIGANHITTKTPAYSVLLGFLLLYSVNKNITVGTIVKYAPQFDATLKAKKLGIGRFDLENKDELIVELPFVYSFKINKCYDGTIALDPYYRYLKKGKGKARTAVCAPADIAGLFIHWWGIKLLFGANF